MELGPRSFPTAAGWCFARTKPSSSRPTPAKAGGEPGPITAGGDHGPRFRGDDRWPDARLASFRQNARWVRFAKMHLARVGRARSLPRHALAGPIPVFSCFSADSESSIPGLTISSTHTPPRSRGARLRPGFASFASPTRVEGWAERRETFGCSAEHPWGTPSCVKDARERAYDAACQALARRLASHSASRRA
jgi:hypothetical protein